MTYGYLIERERLGDIVARAIPFREHVDGLYSAPEEIDPRPWHRIEDQGQMGSCQGHALASVCEYAYHVATGQVTQFSNMWCYLISQKVDNLIGRDVGSTLAGGLECARNYGLCPEDVFPYPRRYTTEIPEGAYSAAEPYKIRSHSMCRSYADVFAYLASGLGGVEVGTMWGWEPDGQGLVEQFRPGGGGHATCFLGYSKRKDRQGRNYLWHANSWSERWGNQGWAEVAPAAVDAAAKHSFTVMIGMSDLSVPRPRKINWIENSVYGF